MARARIDLDHFGMGAMLRSAPVGIALDGIAEDVEMAAQKLAHRDAFETGEYMDSIHIEQDETDRARRFVVASDWKSAIIESRLRILGRALGGR